MKSLDTLCVEALYKSTTFNLFSPLRVCVLNVQSVSNCGRITDDGVRSLCTSTAITDNLTVLELDSCMQITDECLEHISACRRLQRLEVFDNRQITRPAIEHYMVSVGIAGGGI